MPKVLCESPLGPLTVVLEGDAITGLAFRALPDAAPPATPAGHRAVVALARYFHDTTLPPDLALRPPGTPFQRRVWEALRAIPPGETATYGKVAAAAGLPRGARATGQACAANPIAILIPCHRAVGVANPTAWSGLPGAKEWLLAHEARCARGGDASPAGVAARQCPPTCRTGSTPSPPPPRR